MASVTAHFTSFDGSTNVYDDPTDLVWTNPTNAGASDDARATAAMNSAIAHVNHTCYLWCLAHDGGLNAIPVGATINGIQIDIEKRKTAGLGNAKDNSLRLIKGGALVGDDKASALAYGGSDAVASYGGAADLWGTTWTRAQVVAADFGVGLSCKAEAGTATAGIDDIIVTVTYTLAVLFASPFVGGARGMFRGFGRR